MTHTIRRVIHIDGNFSQCVDPFLLFFNQIKLFDALSFNKSADGL